MKNINETTVTLSPNEAIVLADYSHLLELVNEFQFSFEDPLAWVAVFRKDNRWEMKDLPQLCECDYDRNTITAEDAESAKELLNILKIDPDAILVNSWYTNIGISFYEDDYDALAVTKSIDELYKAHRLLLRDWTLPVVHEFQAYVNGRSTNLAVTNQDIDNLLTAAVSGGMGWCSKIIKDGDINTNGHLIVAQSESSSENSIDLHDLLRGFKEYISNDVKNSIIFTDKNGVHSVDMCLVDADTAEEILQTALFGELMF